jgi:hypothetical protein
MAITALARGMFASGRNIIRKGWTSVDDICSEMPPVTCVEVK